MNNSGLTPLMVAILGADSVDNAEMIIRILATGDKHLDIPDTSGRTALHLAASTIQTHDIRRRVVKILETAGAQLNVRDVNADTPVDLEYRAFKNTLFE